MNEQMRAGDAVILKVGTNTLVTSRGGRERLDTDSFLRIGNQVRQLTKMGVHVMIVTSAAITAGMVKTATRSRPDKASHMNELQRLASIGNPLILNAWADAIDPLVSGQLLLTRSELKDDAQAQERKETLSTIQTLWSHNEVPIVNENDAITHEEISFGDNDMLAALLAARVNSIPEFGGRTRLIILSDINGVYADIANGNSLISRYDFDDEPSIQIGSVGANGTGGICSKLAAARFGVERNVRVVLTNGRAEDAVILPVRSGLGTRFCLSTMYNFV